MKQVDKKKIIDAAFHIFVRDKIESAKMSEIAQAAGVGRATLFRHYPSKLELVIAVNAAKWKEYLDELDEKRPIASINEIPAIDRFIFTMDSYIDMCVNHKALLQFNDNFNHFVSRAGTDSAMLIILSYLYIRQIQDFLKCMRKPKKTIHSERIFRLRSLCVRRFTS